ncbi:hypothetical protein NFI96_008697, partial [Prochilodus magdalenae]
RIAKKKTHVKKCTLNPVFNESFIYDVPAELMPDISIEFLLIDFDRTTKNEVVGRLVLGGQSPTPSGVTHWREVCDNPRRQIAKWHNLAEHWGTAQSPDLNPIEHLCDELEQSQAFFIRNAVLEEC